MIKLEMTRKQEAILAAIIIVAALVFFVQSTGIFRSSGSSNDSDAAAEPAPEPLLADIVDEYIADYDDAENEYLTLLEEGNYTFDSPLIITDPYGTSPLTALLLFTTEEPASIMTNVTGKTPDTAVIRRYPDFATTHFIPIFGLYPDTNNIVEITILPQETTEPAHTAIIMVRTDNISKDLPGSILKQDSDTRSLARGNPQLYFSHENISAFDFGGDYRWCYDGIKTDYPVQYLDSGNMLLIIGNPGAPGEDAKAFVLEINLLGRIINAMPIDTDYEIPEYGAQTLTLKTL